MLINRMIERVRGLGLSRVLLARRARAVRVRTPVVLVLPVLGNRLLDGRGRAVWGSTARVFLSRGPADEPDLRPGSIVEGLTLVPGLYQYDIFGGMVRFLEDVGGYVRGEDLFSLEYDFRTGVIDAATRLAELVERIRGVGDERVDLVGISSGGLIARYFLASSGLLSSVRKVVYVGAPQRGSVSTIDRLHDGVVPAPFARLSTGQRLWQTSYDFLPHPDDPLFVDELGRPQKIDLYDAATWARLRIADPTVPDLQGKLDRGRKLNQALDGEGAHPDTLVIAARHQPTVTRLVVTGGVVKVPPCGEPAPDDPLRDVVYAPGDGAMSEATMLAVPGLDPSRVWYATPAEHHEFPATPEVHRLILEALLASERAIPEAAPIDRKLVELIGRRVSP